MCSVRQSLLNTNANQQGAKAPITKEKYMDYLFPFVAFAAFIALLYLLSINEEE